MCSMQSFRAQMEYLRRRFSIISLKRFFETQEISMRPTFMVTFDDGWADNYDYAYPILKRYGIPATIFLTTDFVQEGKPFWHTRLIYLLLQSDLIKLEPEKLDRQLFPDAVIKSLERLKGLGREIRIEEVDEVIGDLKAYDEEHIERMISDLAKRLELSFETLSERRLALTWDQVREMAAHQMEYGSHGVTHRILTTLSPEEVDMEARQSKKIIEERLKSPVLFIVCPNGDTNEMVDRRLRQAGYRYIFPFFDGMANDSTRKLKRINIHDGLCSNPFGRFSKSLFAFELCGLKAALLGRAE